MNFIKKEVQVKLVALDDLPDLSEIEKLNRYDRFSTFNRTHLKYANQLIEILMGELNITTAVEEPVRAKTT